MGCACGASSNLYLVSSPSSGVEVIQKSGESGGHNDQGEMGCECGATQNQIRDPLQFLGVQVNLKSESRIQNECTSEVIGLLPLGMPNKLGKIPQPQPINVQCIVLTFCCVVENSMQSEKVVLREYSDTQNQECDMLSSGQSGGNISSIKSSDVSIIIPLTASIDSLQKKRKIFPECLQKQLLNRKGSTSLGIQGFFQSHKIILTTIKNHFKEIKQLILENCGIGDEMLLEICQITSLVKINIAYNPLTEKGFGRLKFSGIRSVVLGSKNMEEKTLTGIMSHLQEIKSFHYKTDFNGNSLKALLSTANQLKKLTLNKDILSIIHIEQLIALAKTNELILQLTIKISNPQDNKISNQTVLQILNQAQSEDITAKY